MKIATGILKRSKVSLSYKKGESEDKIKKICRTFSNLLPKNIYAYKDGSQFYSKKSKIQCSLIFDCHFLLTKKYAYFLYMNDKSNSSDIETALELPKDILNLNKEIELSDFFFKFDLPQRFSTLLKEHDKKKESEKELKKQMANLEEKNKELKEKEKKLEEMEKKKEKKFTDKEMDLLSRESQLDEESKLLKQKENKLNSLEKQIENEKEELSNRERY